MFHIVAEVPSTVELDIPKPRNAFLPSLLTNSRRQTAVGLAVSACFAVPSLAHDAAEAHIEAAAKGSWSEAIASPQATVAYIGQRALRAGVAKDPNDSSVLSIVTTCGSGERPFYNELKVQTDQRVSFEKQSDGSTQRITTVVPTAVRIYRNTPDMIQTIDIGMYQANWNSAPDKKSIRADYQNPVEDTDTVYTSYKDQLSNTSSGSTAIVMGKHQQRDILDAAVLAADSILQNTKQSCKLSVPAMPKPSK